MKRLFGALKEIGPWRLGRPLRPTAAEPASDTAPKPESQLPPDGARPWRVLLLDDHGGGEALLADYRKAYRCQSYSVSDPSELMEAFLAPPWDVVLINLALEDHDGVEVIRAIRSLSPPSAAVPVLGFGPALGDDDADPYLAAGMDDVLTVVDGQLTAEAIVRWHGPAPAAQEPGGPLNPYGRVRLAANTGPQAVQRLLRKMIAEFPSLLDMVERHSGEPNSCRISAHTLKTMAMMIGADVLAAQARHIEALCAAGDSPAPGDVNGLRAETERTLEACRQMLV